jgi:hypothetical protein
VLSQFFDALSGGVASSWLTLVRAPSVILGGIGALAWWYAHPDVDVGARFHTLTSTEQILIVIVAAALLIGSSMALDQASRPLLRILEGYWWRILKRPREKLIARQIGKERRLRSRWNELARAPADAGSRDAQAVAATATRDRDYSKLDVRLHDYPADEARTMPTLLGNVLRASEMYSQERYGLDAVIVWPRLWLLLPETAQQELVASRRALDNSVAAMAALALSLVWVIWAWWVVPLSLLGVPLIYRSFAVPRAQVMAQLVTGAFDLYRSALYQALRFPLPDDPDTEPHIGAGISQYLWRGFPPAGWTFVDPAASPAGDADSAAVGTVD